MLFPGETQDSRAAIIDVLCKTDKGTHVLVELLETCEKGIEQGLLQEKKRLSMQVAENLRNRGFSEDDIAESLGLTLDEYKKLLADD